MDEVLARYTALDAGTPSAPRRYLLVSAGQEGWGNRMLVLASALLACLHTQRRLVLDWPVEPAWRAGIALPPFSWPARSRPCTRTAVCGRSVPFLARRPNCRCRRKKAQGGAARPAGGVLHGTETPRASRLLARIARSPASWGCVRDRRG